MEMNKGLLDKKIRIAKKTIASMYHFKDKERIARLERLNKEICLAVAGFKCQKCGATKNLQIHHLILRRAKEYMDFFRYASQRYYWANQVVLCRECHFKYHNNLGESKNVGEVPNKLCISEKEIKRIKKKYLKK